MQSLTDLEGWLVYVVTSRPSVWHVIGTRQLHGMVRRFRIHEGDLFFGISAESALRTITSHSIFNP